MTDANEIYTKPWDQQEGEPPKAFVGFRVFLALEAPRNYRRAAEELDLGFDHIKAWGARYNWQERARKYDTWRNGSADTASMDVIKMFQTQVISEEVRDYQKMRHVWEVYFDGMMTKVEEIEPREFLERMRILIQTRTLIDNLGRRSAALPNSYRGVEKPPDETPSDAPFMLTLNGPKQLGESDSFGEDDK